MRKNNPDSGFKPRLQLKLMVIFAIYSIIIISVGGIYSYRSINSLMEEELGRKLIQTGNSFADTVFPFQLSLGKGAEGTQTYKTLQNRLVNYIRNFDLNYMIILDKSGTVLVSPYNDYQIGDRYDLIRIDEEEFNLVTTGISVDSILYQGPGGEYFKSGFVPITNEDDEVIGIVVLEASAKFLTILNKIKNAIIITGIITLLISLIIGFILGKSLTFPLQKVISGLQMIGEGDLNHEIQVNSGDEIGFMAHSFNLMADKLKQRDKELRMLAAGVAHEIRNPLMGIKGSVTLISRNIEDDDSKELLRNIVNEIRALENLVNEFMMFARFSEPMFSPSNLVEIIDLVLGLYAENLDAKRIRVKKSLPDKLEVDCDPEKIKRVFTNLIKNSIDAFEQDHSGKIKIIGRQEEDQVSIQIMDTARGIPDEELENIFEPFFTTKEKGTGLGLAIVKKIIDQHNGRIYITPNSPAGVIVTIILPRFNDNYDRRKYA